MFILINVALIVSSMFIASVAMGGEEEPAESPATVMKVELKPHWSDKIIEDARNAGRL